MTVADDAARRKRRDQAGARAALTRALRALEQAAAHPDPALLSRLAVDAARSLLGLEGAVLYWWDDEAALLWPLASNDPRSLTPHPVINAGQGAMGRAFQQARTIVLEDYQQWEHRLSGGLAARFGSVVAAPIIAEGQPLGALMAMSFTPRRLLPWQASALEQIAARIAGAAGSMVFYAAAERRRTEAEALAELMRLGAAETEVDRVVDLVTAYAGRLLGADYTAVALLREDGATAWQGAWGARTETWRGVVLPPGKGTAGRALAAGGTVLLERLGENPAYPRDENPAYPRDEFPLHLSEGGRTALGTPLISRERAVGALILGWRHDATVQAEQVRLAETLASYAATIIDTARAGEERAHLLEHAQKAHAEAEEARQRLAFLAEASELLAASFDDDETLRSVARLAVPNLADWCNLVLSDEDGTIRRIEFVHVDPAKQRLLQEMERHYPLSRSAPHGVVGALRSGRSELVSYIPAAGVEAFARDAEHLRLLRAIGLTSTMSVPLRARDRILGAITFGTGESERHYAEADLALAEDFARRVALAVDNARLYQEAQEAAAIREADRLKGELLSTVSHELRTPLGAIKGFASGLLEYGDRLNPAEHHEALRLIDDSADRLTELVDNLLRVQRLEAGLLEIRRAPVDVAALAYAAADEARAKAPRHRLEVAAEEGLPTVTGDERRLRQIVQNLLGNAVKYSPDGGHVELRVARRGASVELRVTDQGIGIPREHLGRVFERFHRVDNSMTRRIGGTGLGLAIVKGLVEAHGGQVWAESAGPGRGSSFVVRLPLP